MPWYFSASEMHCVCALYVSTSRVLLQSMHVRYQQLWQRARWESTFGFVTDCWQWSQEKVTMVASGLRDR